MIAAVGTRRWHVKMAGDIMVTVKETELLIPSFCQGHVFVQSWLLEAPHSGLSQEYLQPEHAPTKLTDQGWIDL